MTFASRMLRICRAVTMLAATFVCLTGAAVLVGWALQIGALERLFSRVAMKANTAVALMSAGAVLALVRRRDIPPGLRRAGRLLAAVFFCFVALMLSQHITGWNLGIDRLFFSDVEHGASRISVPVCLGLLLAFVALMLILSERPRAITAAQVISFGIALIALMPVIGYTFVTPSASTATPWSTISPHSAVAMMVLALGMLAARCQQGPMAIITAAGPGGKMARRLLLPATMLPLVMGWLRALSDANQLLDVSVARPLSITIMITTYGAAIWWNARTVTQVDDDRARLDEERLAAEREVRASEARFRRVSECGMIGIVFGNIHGNIYDANDAFLKVIGATRDEVRAGKLRWADLTAPEQRRLDEKAIVEMQHCGVAVPYEKEYIRADGVRVPVLIGVAFLEGSRTDTVAFVLDLSYRRQMEEMSQQQQQAIAHLARVTTVGEMAAGLAHELNQPLGAILNNASAAIDAVSGEEQMIAGINDALEDIASEARRAGEIIRRVRNFVRKQRPRFAAAQVNGMIREAVGLMAADLRRSGVRLDLKLADNLPEAMADNVQIEQVLVNVLRNALDAMASIKPSERRLVIHSDAPDRLSVRVRITDSGCGATAESCDEMFNAFFTTKAEGMGMGLAISRSIIEAHGGHIQAKANPGRGITMEFSLPVAAACEALA